jgi:hypothetical protein
MTAVSLVAYAVAIVSAAVPSRPQMIGILRLFSGVKPCAASRSEA